MEGDFTRTYRRAFVMLSGGVDSATALWLAKRDYGVGHVTAVSFDYGQRHQRELTSAANLAHVGDTGHEVLDLGALLRSPNVMLTDVSVRIPEMSYSDIQGISPTYVPYRNGTMLSVLAAHAMKYVKSVQEEQRISPDSPMLKDLVGIYFGAHAEDAFNWAYPDCTPEFIGAQANAIYIGSYRTVRLVTPFVHSMKWEIVVKGVALGVPYNLTWSCYAGGSKHCGVCPTCRARKDAFQRAIVIDPTDYAA